MEARRRRGPARRSRREGLIGLGAGTVTALVVAALLFVPGGEPSGPLPTQAASLVLGGSLGSFGPSFFAVSAQSSSLTSPTTEGLVGHTPFTAFRWGPDDEYTNLSAGLVYDDNGVASPVGPDNLSAFVAFCRALACRAELSVPGEINSTVVAVETVAYVEQTLGFHPAFWSVGNEPETWEHFNEPWASWRSTDRSPVTPAEYALEVHRYIAAIREVDPAAQFIGIQAAGGDLVEAEDWIAPVAALNAPNLSAVAYHPYPGGEGSAGATVADFFSSLSRPTAFPNSYAAAQAAVAAGCHCSVPLWAGEYNSALGGNYSAFLAGYPNVPYLAAGLLLALKAGVPQVTYFTLSTPGPGFGLLDEERPRPSYSLYSVFLENLTVGGVVNASLPGAPSQVYAVETVNGSRASLLVVDANPAVNVALNLTESGFPLAGGGRVYSWDPSESAPAIRSLPGPLPSAYLLPAEGVLLLDVG